MVRYTIEHLSTLVADARAGMIANQRENERFICHLTWIVIIIVSGFLFLIWLFSTITAVDYWWDDVAMNRMWMIDTFTTLPLMVAVGSMCIAWMSIPLACVNRLIEEVDATLVVRSAHRCGLCTMGCIITVGVLGYMASLLFNSVTSIVLIVKLAMPPTGELSPYSRRVFTVLFSTNFYGKVGFTGVIALLSTLLGCYGCQVLKSLDPVLTSPPLDTLIEIIIIEEIEDASPTIQPDRSAESHDPPVQPMTSGGLAIKKGAGLPLY